MIITNETFITYNNHQYSHVKKENISESTDIILVGAGIMSATLGMFLVLLEPTWKINIYERLKQPAQESSNAWNNAGTGHAAYCELNYTKYNNTNDTVDIAKAIAINEAFEISRQFWAYLVERKILINPRSFINNIPHMSFVWGENNINFLKKRYQALQNSILFHGMFYSEDRDQIHQWAPLIINGRNKSQKIAATYMEIGTDVNFGEITEQILTTLEKHPNCKIHFQHEIIRIQHHNNSTWNIHAINLRNHQKKSINSNYIFLGCGGKSLSLLQTSGIHATFEYAGFPVSGQFLVTKNPKIVEQHSTKTYGKASVNTPPMSTPHIDARILNGNKIVLFGPFATLSSKFLKYGSWLDLFRSLNPHNILPIIQSGIDNLELIKYIISQLIMSNNKRINTLKEYYPLANIADWSLIQAGQRVQIIKKNNKKRGILQFGTEVVGSEDGSLLALLGASPGASTAASITLTILNKMFSNNINSDSWKKKLKEIIPSYLNTLDNNIVLANKIRQYTTKMLDLTYLEIIQNQKYNS